MKFLQNADNPTPSYTRKQKNMCNGNDTEHNFPTKYKNQISLQTSSRKMQQIKWKIQGDRSIVTSLFKRRNINKI